MTLGGRVWRGRATGGKTQSPAMESRKQNSANRQVSHRKSLSFGNDVFCNSHDAANPRTDVHSPSLPIRRVRERRSKEKPACGQIDGFKPIKKWRLDDVPLIASGITSGIRKEIGPNVKSTSNLCCLTAFDEFANWSIEELRFKAYKCSMQNTSCLSASINSAASEPRRREPQLRTHNNFPNIGIPPDALPTGQQSNASPVFSITSNMFTSDTSTTSSLSSDTEEMSANSIPFIQEQQNRLGIDNNNLHKAPGNENPFRSHSFHNDGVDHIKRDSTLQDSPANLADSFSLACDGKDTDVAKWLTKQLTSSSNFLHILREALQIQSQHLVAEKDRAIEQRNMAEQEAISAGMELMSMRSKFESCQAESECSIQELREKIETLQKECNTKQAALHAAQEENKLGMQEMQELEDELNAAILQSSQAVEECGELRRTLKHLEFKLRRSEQIQQSLEQDLKEAQSQAQHGVEMRQQLAKTLLRSLDMPYENARMGSSEEAPITEFTQTRGKTEKFNK